MKFGILALQGDFAKHLEKLKDLEQDVGYVREARDLENLSALVIPGGESTTLLKLLGPEFFAKLQEIIAKGLPVLATCAGVILLAREVKEPEQKSLGVLDLSVRRNAYGRQANSFIENNLRWTEQGKKILSSSMSSIVNDPIEGVFIRAPKIEQLGQKVEVMIEQNGDAVLVKQGNVWGATFHPELSSRSVVHQGFVESVISY